MKKLIITTLLILSSGCLLAQTNREIANVYLKKAQNHYAKLETNLALVNFNKSIKLLDTITRSSVAKLGVLIHFELQNYKEAQYYAKQYFLLVKNKKTDDYQKLLELYVEIRDELDVQLAEEKKLEEQRLKKEKELHRLDSLNLVWQKNVESMVVKADYLSDFDKNALALFKNGKNYGVIDDSGIIIVEADSFKTAIHFDGYFILMNKVENPTKIYCFNGTTKNGFNLPDISEFNPLSTHYGQVMMPRGNNKLIAYPNNTLKVLKYDLINRKFETFDNEKSILKDLKSKKFISSYNKNNEVRINKKWYRFGGNIGGGISPLYNKDYSISGFLSAINGQVLEKSMYNYIGSFYNDKLQVLTNGETFWINQIGTTVEAPIDESGSYNGSVNVEKLDKGGYLFYQSREGVKVYILGDKELLNKNDFIQKN